MTYQSFLNTFFIKPKDPTTDLGIFTIKGELSDSRSSSNFSFKINIYNNPPHMKDNITDLTIQLGVLSNYTLPDIDDEEGLPIIIIP